MLIKLMLKKLNLECDIANNGLEAVEMVKEQDYALILMDENMPVMNGIEATKQIREIKLNQPLKIIAVTANALKGDKQKFLDAGMDDYLSKPIDKHEFVTMLKQHL
jgi:CheY-like chemotaxis protein